MHLVVINTAGKQRFIFSSRKRQEIVGASGLITQVDGAWAQQALRETFPGFHRGWRIADGHDAELILAGAGTVTALVKDPDAGRRLVTGLTRRALTEAPGLDVCGVVHAHPADRPLAESLRTAREELAAVQEARPGPQGRFLRLPLVEDCRSSGLPASGLHREGPDAPLTTRSADSAAKLAHFPYALERLAQEAQTDQPTMRKIVDHLGLEAEWVAVVHADGNGFGRLFRELGDHFAGADAAYADALRVLSRRADACARRAFCTALERTRAALEPISATEDRKPRVLPLILGGDDLTVLCAGEIALPFTRHYLEAFEEQTASDPTLRPLLEKMGCTRLGAAAGVAIVKRNYPFRFAYDLAEELARAEAKTVKDWASALAFAVLLESSAPDLGRLRRAATGTGTTPAGAVTLSASPYVVGEGSRDPRAAERRWDDLQRRVAALRRKDPVSGEPLVPGGAVHDLREGLCLGLEVAQARLGLLRTRFADSSARLKALAELGDASGRLAWPADEQTTVTGLIDAMAALPFLPEEQGER